MNFTWITIAVVVAVIAAMAPVSQGQCSGGCTPPKKCITDKNGNNAHCE